MTITQWEVQEGGILGDVRKGNESESGREVRREAEGSCMCVCVCVCVCVRSVCVLMCVYVHMYFYTSGGEGMSVYVSVCL